MFPQHSHAYVATHLETKRNFKNQHGKQQERTPEIERKSNTRD